MSAPGGIFNQPGIPCSKAAHCAVAQPNFQLAGEDNHILSAWGWMPVDEHSDRQLIKDYMCCGLWCCQCRMGRETLVFDARLPIVAIVESKYTHRLVPPLGAYPVTVQLQDVYCSTQHDNDWSMPRSALPSFEPRFGMACPTDFDSTTDFLPKG